MGDQRWSSTRMVCGKVALWQAHGPRDPILQERICTQETGETTAEGMPITACRLLQTGRCDDPASVRVHGTLYTEVIFTYLRHGQRE